jgi:hypothetical protein
MAHPIENLNQFNAEEAGNMEEIEMQFVSRERRAIERRSVGARHLQLLGRSPAGRDEQH